MLVRLTKEQVLFLEKMMEEEKPIDVTEENGEKIGEFITSITKVE